LIGEPAGADLDHVLWDMTAWWWLAEEEDRKPQAAG
jgi:hypothetical protein